MKKALLVLLLVLSIAAFATDSKAKAKAKEAVETELKLEAIYNQHSASNAGMGFRLEALADKNCADLHASAAEMIIESPANAKIAPAEVKKSCDEMIQQAADTAAERSKEGLRQACQQTVELGEHTHTKDEIKQCASVGVDLPGKRASKSK